MNKKDISEQYESDRDAIRTVVDTFDEKESMLVSKVEDSLTNSSTFRSRVTDSRLSTIIWERSARVMGQLPKGQVKAIGMKDKGKSLLMDIILQRYIMPNANSQYSHLMKLRMWDLYSMVYGVMPMMYDYRIDDDYVGPDCWIIPIRNWTPQRGKLSMEDCDYTHVDNYVSKKWLEKKAEQKSGGWKASAIKKLINNIDSSSTRQKYDESSYVERDRNTDKIPQKGKHSQIKLTTRYERGMDGKWITFAPDYDGEIIRELDNPHKDGKIPVVLKYCFPLIDSIYGLGDFERGKTIQYAMDSLINLYLDGVKMSVFPPTVMNPTGVVPSSIRYSPGAKWLENIPNSIRTHNVSPQGLTTFQSTYSFLIGSLLNQNGTTDTAQNSEATSDPGFGKTPQALKMLESRESSRDNWDRFMMEEAVERLYNGMTCLLATKQPKPIELEIFGNEIQQIAELYPDIAQLIEVSESGEFGKITIKPTEFKDIKYRYFIEANSTTRKEEAEQSESLTNLLLAVSKIPGLQQELAKENIKYSIGEHIRRIFATSGVEEYDKILYPMTQEDIQAQQAQEAQGNLNQPPQVPGGQGGDVTPPSIAEPESQQQMQQEMAMQQPPQQPQQQQMPPKPMQMPQLNDPELQELANQMFGG